MRMALTTLCDIVCVCLQVPRDADCGIGDAGSEVEAFVMAMLWRKAYHSKRGWGSR